MCKTLLSFVDHRAPVSPSKEDSREQRRLLRRIFKVAVTQDLAKRSNLPFPSITQLAFQKFTEMPGLLGEQFFTALDVDNDNYLGLEDFTDGFLTLYQGSYTDVANLLFRVLDFGQKGYITPDDMRFTLLYLPSVCSKCGKRVVQHWHICEKIAACFQGREILKDDDFLEAIRAENEVFNHILQALLNSLPVAFDDVLIEDVECEGVIDRKPEQEYGLMPLRYKDRRHFFELRNQALYFYNSVQSTSPKGVILVKSLFAEPRDATCFALHDSTITYIFEAPSQQARDQWLGRLRRETGHRVFEDFYECHELLGEGSFSEVLRATSRATGQSVAVKVIHKEPLEEKSEIRLRREIDILKHVKHPNLLQLQDVFETQEKLYIVTEFVPGGSLFEWLEERNFRISEKAAKSIIADITRGLAFLHENGVVHRDVKLENVLLVREGSQVTAKLIDYGLSCFLGPGQTSKEPVGTLKYAAPEVIARQQYRHKADCWGLGVIMYILLKGTVPFYGKTDQEVALEILKKKLTLEGEDWAHVSAHAKSVLASLLNRNPEARPELSDLLTDQWLL